MNLQQIKIGDWAAHPKNYNHHSEDQIRRLAASLDRLTQFKNIVVWEHPIDEVKGYIVAGHGLALAAESLGRDSLYATVLPADTPEHVIDAVMVADNEIAKQSDPDTEQLADLLESIRREDAALLDSTGWGSDELDELLRGLVQPNDIEWEMGFESLPDGDREPFQQMTFTLHDSQIEIVKSAIGAVDADFAESPNQNSNGNALAYICEAFTDGIS